MDLGLVTSAFSTLRLAPPPRLVLLEAADLQSAHVPPYPPDCPALLVGVGSREMAMHVRDVLLAAYPQAHQILQVDANSLTTKTKSHQGAKERNFVTLSLSDFVVKDGSAFRFSDTTCLYIPPLDQGASFEALAEIVAHLRAPNGCPWDREQTHESLRTHLLEETYEVLAAIDSRDLGAMREEFGDMLLQVILQTQIAAEAGEFVIAQVVKNIHDKLIRRHPHVFAGVEVDGVEGVLANWEKLKQEERVKKKEGKGLLDGVPAALPALSQAQEYQGRAARVGFDWPEIGGVLDKIAEEIREVKESDDPGALAEELGDLFFALVNLARWKRVDAESALRQTNIKFKRRFAYVENEAKTRGKPLLDMSLEEMDALWEDAKKKEG
ncbi:MAG TPA: nucleoside triphosphate pyrophosphohydrolase [Anaerolineales bacterium]